MYAVSGNEKGAAGVRRNTVRLSIGTEHVDTSSPTWKRPSPP